MIEDEEGNVLEVLEQQQSKPEPERTEELEAEMDKLMDTEDIQHGVSQTQDEEDPKDRRRERRQSSG